MNYNIISTGSCGNAVVINDTILIDCGVSFKKLHNVYKGLKLVLLTHIHSDHFNRRTIKELAKNKPTLRFGACWWLIDDLVRCGVDKRNIDVLKCGKFADYKAFKVNPVKLTHNVENCGFKVHFGDEKLFYATDTGSLKGITAKGYDLYMVEANYTTDDIKKRIEEKQAAGIFPYEYDVMKNHLSKEKCDDFIYQNIADGEYVYLHQHQSKVMKWTL